MKAKVSTKNRTPNSLMELKSAPERARDAIREMINSGDIESGSRIDQRRLATKLKLTTVPVREALNWLEAEGLVKRIPGCGVFCKTYTVDDIQELVELRGALESLAAGIVAEKIGASQKTVLKTLSEEMSQVEEENQDGFLKLHVAFHDKIIELSGNHVLFKIWRFTHITEQVLVRLSAHLWPVLLHDHRDIVDAIAVGDRKLAETAMRNHIVPAYEERLKILREEYGDQPIL